MKRTVALAACLLLSALLVACAQPAEPTEPVSTAPEGAVAVSTVEQLQQAFSRLNTDDLIWLENDIDMAGQTLAVVNSRSFTLDGNGHTISNYHITGKSALFVDNGADQRYTIQNLTLKDCSVVSDDDYAALFVGAARDTDTVSVLNCHAINCAVTGDKYAALFIAYTAGTNKGNGQRIEMTVSGCSAQDCAITGGGSTGLAIAHSGGNELTRNVICDLILTNCAVNGPGEQYEGVIIGTAGVGITEISGITAENVTTACNRAEGARRYYGRNLTTLLIDGQKQEKTNA